MDSAWPTACHTVSAQWVWGATLQEVPCSTLSLQIMLRWARASVGNSHVDLYRSVPGGPCSCPSAGCLIYQDSFSAPAVRYPPQRQEVPTSQVCRIRPAGSNPNDLPSQLLQRNSISDPQRGEYGAEAFEEGHVRSSANSPGSQGNSLCHFKYWVFRLELAREPQAAIIVKTSAQRGEALSLVCLDLSKRLPAACGLLSIS